MSTLSSKNSEPERNNSTEEAAESLETEGAISEGTVFADRSMRVSLEPSNILKLQKSVGNKTVSRIIARARDTETKTTPKVARVRNGVQRTPKAIIQRETTLTEGMTSDEVKTLQTKLNQVHASDPPLKIDGIFGPKTKAAVISFQQGKDGITPNGTVEDKTWVALNKAVTDVTATPPGGSTTPPGGTTTPPADTSGSGATPPTTTPPGGTTTPPADTSSAGSTPPTTTPPGGSGATPPTTTGSTTGGPTSTPPTTGGPTTTPPSGSGSPPPGGSGTPAPAEPDSVEVRKKLNKLGVADTNGNQIVLAETGAYDDAVRSAIKAFQKSRGLPDNGTVDAKTQAAMDATVTNVKGSKNEVVGGVTYGVKWNYDWQVTDTQIHITVKIKYTNGPGVTDAQKGTKTAAWMGFIKEIWNIFKAVNPADGKSLDIVFDPIVVTGSEQATVQVAAGSGRANAGKWYVVGGTDEKKVIAHEFGHLISLPDEYQLSHKDFKDTTGVDAPAGATTATGNPTADTVATKMKEALDEADQPTRVTKASGVVSTYGLKQGSFTQSVVDKYKEKYSKDLVSELASKIPVANQWGIIDPFTSSSGGIMGNFFSEAQGGKGDNAINSKMSATDTHEHPLAPRHVAPFIEHIKTAKGGTWEAQLK